MRLIVAKSSFSWAKFLWSFILKYLLLKFYSKVYPKENGAGKNLPYEFYKCLYNYHVSRVKVGTPVIASKSR